MSNRDLVNEIEQGKNNMQENELFLGILTYFIFMVLTQLHLFRLGYLFRSLFR